MLLTRSPLVYPQRGLTVRLACVKHTASVRPEPGSNSPSKKQKPQTHPHQTDAGTPKNIRQKTQSPTNPHNTHKRAHCRGKSIKGKNKKQTKKTILVHPQKNGIDLKHAVEFSRFGSHQSSNPVNFTAFPPNVKFSVFALSCTLFRFHRPFGQLLHCTPRIPVSQTGLPGLFLGDVDKHVALSGIHLIAHSPRGSSTGECPGLSLPSAFGGEREHYTLPGRCATRL